MHVSSITVYGHGAVLLSGLPAHVSVVKSLFIAGGQLDLSNNDLILDYSGVTPIASIADAIKSGNDFINGGPKTDSGIFSKRRTIKPVKSFSNSRTIFKERGK